MLDDILYFLQCKHDKRAVQLWLSKMTNVVDLGHCITHCSSHFSAEHGELASKGLRYIYISLYLQYLGIAMVFCTVQRNWAEA